MTRRLTGALLVAISILLVMPASGHAQTHQWEKVTGAARDIAIADDGTVWVIGNTKAPGGYRIYKSSSNNIAWTAVPGAAVRIAVESETPWIVDERGIVFRWSGGRWQTVGAPQAVDVGASAKGVWIAAKPNRGDDYTILQWLGSISRGWKTWDRAGVRLDVDADGNPWVVNSAGQLHANVKGKWQQFGTVRDAQGRYAPASDVSVHTFGAPWAVTTTGDLWYFNKASNKPSKWEKEATAANAIAQRGGLTWHLGVKQEIFRSKGIAVNLPTAQLNVDQPDIQVKPPTNEHLTVTEQNIVESGTIELQNQPNLRPNGNISDSTTLNLSDTQPATGELTLVGDCRKRPNDPLCKLSGAQLTIQGCAVNPELPDCGTSNAATTTAASRGQDVYPEPGLGAFLVNGGLPLFEQLYKQPAAIVAALKSSYQSQASRADAFENICRNPVQNTEMKGIMYGVLEAAIKTPRNQRSSDQQRLVEAFANYMYHRRLFIVERAQWLYNEWKLKWMTAHAKSPMAASYDFLRMPPDVLDLAADAAVAGIAAGGIIGATAAVPAFAAAQTAAIAAAGGTLAKSMTIGALMTGGAAGMSGAGLAALAAGPASIILAGAAVSALAVIKAVRIGEYEAKLAKSIEDAKKPINLEELVKTDKGRGEIAYYWARAVSMPGAIVFKSNGDRTTACKDASPKLESVPASVSGGRLVILSSVTLKSKNTGKTYTFGPYSMLEASGISIGGGSGFNNLTLGLTVWKALAIARLNCFDESKIGNYLKTGVAECGQSGSQPGLAAGPQWRLGNANALPGTAVVAGKHKNGAALLVCRANMGNGFHPGKMWGRNCNVGWGGKEVSKPKFEVLTVPPTGRVMWVRNRPGRPFPQRTISAGTYTNGSPLYVCRANMGDGVHPGKVWRGKCHVGWGGKEVENAEFDVLVDQTLGTSGNVAGSAVAPTVMSGSSAPEQTVSGPVIPGLSSPSTTTSTVPAKPTTTLATRPTPTPGTGGIQAGTGGIQAGTNVAAKSGNQTILAARPAPAAPMAGPSTDGFAWSTAKGRSLPKQAVVAGKHRNGTDLVVCRADMGDGIHPGKVWRGKCNVGWGGREIAKPAFEVLTSAPNAAKWVAVRPGQPVPKQALMAGKHKNGTDLVVCRANMGDGIHPGKVWGGKCNVGWGGKERAMANYEVLVAKPR